MLYSQLDPSGTGFGSQRTLIHTASGIDGGGAIAADRAGNVYVFWHAPLPGGKDEADRRVWLAHSSDDGKTFSPERVAFNQPTGVCGCCGMNAFADSRGTLHRARCLRGRWPDEAPHPRISRRRHAARPLNSRCPN